MTVRGIVTFASSTADSVEILDLYSFVAVQLQIKTLCDFLLLRVVRPLASFWTRLIARPKCCRSSSPSLGYVGTALLPPLPMAGYHASLFGVKSSHVFSCCSILLVGWQWLHSSRTSHGACATWWPTSFMSCVRPSALRSPGEQSIVNKRPISPTSMLDNALVV